MTTREAGLQAEDKAVQFLEDFGYEVLERNFRAKTGEIDIVARDGETVVFVEVRSRASAAFGSAAATVDHPKRRRIIRTAQAYAQARRLDCPMRFDVIAIDGGVLDHVPDAFQAA